MGICLLDLLSKMRTGKDGQGSINSLKDFDDYARENGEKITYYSKLIKKTQK